MTDQTIAQGMAGFASALSIDDIPLSVIARLKAVLLHDLGVATAGNDAVAGLSPFIDTQPCGDGARIFVTGQRVPLERAIVANAAAMHSRTQDDTQLSAQTHFGCTVLPPLLALGERLGASGTEFLVSMAAAYEVGSRLGAGVAAEATARGFRATTVFGPVAAAVGCGRLMRLKPTELASAIGLAAAFGAGTSQTWFAGTDEWIFQVGVAGRNGLLAAELAQLGATGAPDSLEGRAGTYRAFTGRLPDIRALPPAGPWAVQDVTVKPYPVCVINQLPVATTTLIAEKFDIKVEEVARIDLELTPGERDYPGTDMPGPFPGITAGRMSAQLCLALAIRDRTVTGTALGDFADPDLLALAGRVRVHANDQLGPGECRVRVTTGRGSWTDEDVPPVAPFAWAWEETLDRLIAMADETPLGEHGLGRLASAIDALENATVAALVNETVVAT